MRYAVSVEYDGTQYSGWQRQPFFASTVQQSVEEALQRIANHPVEVVCSGRTDAGVHALAQVIHFDTDAQRDDFSWLAGGNRYLPQDIRFQWIRAVSEDFHARYSAYQRKYRYLMRVGCQPSALWARRCHWSRKALDVSRMRAAAQCLLGEHDFSAFRSSECQSKTPFRFIAQIEVGYAHDWLWFDVVGNAFLHHMVRNIVGTLLAVGDGRRPCDWVADVLHSKDRRRAGVTAPACGLYFVGASYPEVFALPEPRYPEGGLW